jgi:hypothetical protein
MNFTIEALEISWDCPLNTSVFASRICNCAGQNETQRVPRETLQYLSGSSGRMASSIPWYAAGRQPPSWWSFCRRWWSRSKNKINSILLIQFFFLSMRGHVSSCCIISCIDADICLYTMLNADSCFDTLHWCSQVLLYLARCWQLFLYLELMKPAVFMYHAQMKPGLALMRPAVFIPLTDADSCFYTLPWCSQLFSYLALMQTVVFIPCTDAASCFHTLHWCSQ